MVVEMFKIGMIAGAIWGTFRFCMIMVHKQFKIRPVLPKWIIVSGQLSLTYLPGLWFMLLLFSIVKDIVLRLPWKLVVQSCGVGALVTMLFTGGWIFSTRRSGNPY